MEKFNIIVIKTQEIQMDIEADDLEGAKTKANFFIDADAFDWNAPDVQTEYTVLSEDEEEFTE